MRVFVLVISACMAIALVILGATPAIADELPSKPAFGMMDNTGDGSEVVIELAMLVPTSSSEDFVLLHPRFVAQFVAPSGLGAYAGGSASKITGSNASTQTFGVGNLELGGLYQRALSPEVAVGLRLGMIVHTATDDGMLVNVVATGLTRPGDIATSLPESWLRLGVSPTLHLGTWFARVDAGLDIPARQTSGAEPIGHLNVGTGFSQGQWSLTAELGAAHEFSDSEDVSDSNTLKVAGLALRYRGESLSPYVMLSTILDNELRGDIVTTTVGITF